MPAPSHIARFWHAAWHRLHNRRSRPQRLGCEHTHALRSKWWQYQQPQTRGVIIDGVWHCLDHCLERALAESLLPRFAPPAARHRVPLGLLLLARQQLNPEQLRTALAAQHGAGCGRLGDWLQALGFASELQITAALAHQWSCPMLQRPAGLPPTGIPPIPRALLERFILLPVHYVATTATLHVAFCEAIDYTILYAIERMLDCHTEACLAPPSLVQHGLADWTTHRSTREIAFNCLADASECTRIVRGYVLCAAASEIRLARCSNYLWVRLLGGIATPLDLVLHTAPQPGPNPLKLVLTRADGPI
jgi:hypothetical protein